MTQDVFVALTGLIGSLFGTLGGILASSKLINFRLDRLEKKVESLGELVKSTWLLEAKDKMLEEKILRLKNQVESISPKKSNKKEAIQFEI